MTKLKKTAMLAGVCLTALLAGCSPHPITDEQMKMIVDQCKTQGLAIYVFNSPLVSRAECVEVTYKIDKDS